MHHHHRHQDLLPCDHPGEHRALRLPRHPAADMKEKGVRSMSGGKRRTGNSSTRYKLASEQAETNGRHCIISPVLVVSHRSKVSYCSAACGFARSYKPLYARQWQQIDSISDLVSYDTTALPRVVSVARTLSVQRILFRRSNRPLSLTCSSHSVL